MKLLKKLLLILLCIVFVLLCSCGIVLCSSFATLRTIRQVDEQGLLFTMEYKGDYDLDGLFEGDCGDPDRLLGYLVNRLSCGLIPKGLPKGLGLSYTDFACTAFSVTCPDGHVRYGRNYDENARGALVLTADPAEGYDSITVCSPVYLGLDIMKFKNSFIQKFISQGLLMVPMDGMNEAGLAISIEELDHHPALPSTDKPDILPPPLMRLILDRCANVDEAVELIRQFDISEPQQVLSMAEIAGCSYHFLLADADGNSAIVEFDYVNGFEPIILYGQSDHQVVTNHYVTQNLCCEPEGEADSHQRYDTAEAMLSKGGVDEAVCFDILSAVRMEDMYYPEYGEYYCSTQWSSVYDLTEKTLSIAVGRDYDTIYTFSFDVR